MIIMTIENPGKPFEVLGLVRGAMVQTSISQGHDGRPNHRGRRAKGLYRDDGGIPRIALQRMVEQAELLGADAMRHALCVQLDHAGSSRGHSLRHSGQI